MGADVRVRLSPVPPVPVRRAVVREEGDQGPVQLAVLGGHGFALLVRQPAALWYLVRDGANLRVAHDVALDAEVRAAHFSPPRELLALSSTRLLVATQRFVRDGLATNEGDVQVHGFSPYPISFRSTVPRESECSNLAVPVCVSASHIAFGSIRMEPVFMVLGQSAATAASHAIEEATQGCKVLPGTRTEAFIEASNVPVHVRLSGKTMEFDGAGACVAGC